MFTPVELIYLCEDSYEGFLSCVFESFLKKERPENILSENSPQLVLLPSRRIPADSARARRVEAFLPRCLGLSLYRLIQYSYLSCFPQKELYMLMLIQETYEHRSFNLGEEPLHSLYACVRRLERETQHLKGFIRFTDYDGYLVSVIHPQNYVLPLLAGHFADRFPQENLLIYDAEHHAALSCLQGQCELFPLESLALNEVSSPEQQIHTLWKEYCRTVAIEGRLNPPAQRNLMPMHFRKDMTEFEKEVR